MISKSLSTSKKYAALYGELLGEFCQSLYPLLVAHADDYGRLEGDEFTVKHSIVPASPRDQGDVQRALRLLDEVHLIHCYEVAGDRFIQIVDFERHQAGLKKRSPSVFPAPTQQAGRELPHGCDLDASEEDIETWLAKQLEARLIEVPGLSIVTVERQVRRGASYFDILATTEEGPLLLFEVKRLRITDAALQQVLRYKAQLGSKQVIPILVGHGIASGANVLTGKALIVVYDDQKRISVLASYRVKSRDFVLRYVTSEQKGTEQKGTEERAAAAPPSSPSAVENQRPKTAVITRLAHEAIGLLGLQLGTGDIEETVKQRCAELHIPYDSRTVAKAVDSAMAQRKARAS